MSVAETNKDAPANAKPAYKLPVLWPIHPSAYGPTNPPKLPTEVINAIPEAAEIPARNSFGSDQKGPLKLEIPIATNDQSVIESKEELVVPSDIRAMPPTIKGIAAWYRRSSLRSELRETRIIAITAAR